MSAAKPTETYPRGKYVVRMPKSGWRTPDLALTVRRDASVVKEDSLVIIHMFVPTVVLRILLESHSAQV
jgi:hypothetical protein